MALLDLIAYLVMLGCALTVLGAVGIALAVGMAVVFGTFKGLVVGFYEYILKR